MTPPLGCRLDRYLIRQLSGPLFFAMGAFTSLFVSGDLLNLADLVVETGAPIEPALKAFALRLPQVIVWTLPMSVLFATLLTFSRLSASSEIVAMRAGGVSFARVALPAIALSLLVSVVGFAIGEGVAPWANAEARRVMVEEVRGSQLPTITRHVVIKGERGNDLDWFLYANRYDSRERAFYQATLVYMAGNTPVQTSFADRILWLDEAWVMENGWAYLYSPSGDVTVVTYPSHTRRVELGHGPDEVARLQKNPEEMSLAELQEHIAVLRSQGADVRSLEVQMNLKYSIPAASVFFALLGVPLGVQSQRSGASTGFGLSILIIFGYYVVMSVGSALGQAGLLSPFLAAWIQNLLLGVWAGWLLWKRTVK